MKARRNAGLAGVLTVLLCIWALSLPVTAAPPPRLPVGAALRPDLAVPRAVDALAAAHVQRDMLIAKPLDRSLLPGVALPPQLSWAEYATLLRNQDAWGGCYNMALLHVADIVKEMEHPLTPDFSYRYLQYYWESQRGKPGAGDSFDWQQAVFTEHGVCSEASLPSNYDAATPLPPGSPPNGFGNHDISAVPKPTPANDAEAALYHLKLGDPVKDFTVDDARRLLYRYGPLYAEGRFGGVYHVVALVAYDDTTHYFRYINSTWGGYSLLPYDDLTDQTSNGYVTVLRTVENVPSDRSSGPAAYTARVQINHDRRRELTVKLGVEGQQPLVVWNRPNRVACVDATGDLCLDVPLPAYAGSFWPPRYAHRWYVEVTDSRTQGTPGTMERFALARLRQNPNNHTIGKFTSQTYEADLSANNQIPVGPNGTVRFNIPAGEPPKAWRVVAALAQQYKLTLEPASLEILPRQAANLHGLLTVSSVVAKGGTVPAGGKEIRICELIQGGCVNMPPQWTEGAPVVTGPDGTYAYSLTPTKGLHVYAAALYGQDKQVLASSDAIAVTVGPPKPLRLRLFYYDLPKLPGPGPIERPLDRIQPGVR